MPVLRLVFVSALGFCGGIACAQTISFLPPVAAAISAGSYNSEIASNGIAVADFNGDGNMDIAWAATTPYSGDMGVAMGNGDGTFRPGFRVQNGSYHSLGVVAGDFNGDGKPDLFSFGDISSLYLGNGDGTFQAVVKVSACQVSYDSVVAAGDLNHDGKQDLICLSSVLLSNGDGTFRAAGTIGGALVLLADFNRDGVPDVLLTTAAGQLAVALGRGDGTFGPAIVIDNSLNSRLIQAGDFNGDGQTDLAGVSRDGTAILVLPGRGDGTFGPPIRTAGAPGLITAVADFNRDGKLDLVAGDAVLAGNGDGTFRFPVFVGVIAEPCITPYNPPLCDYIHTATAVADFNHDGLPDLASGYIFPSSGTLLPGNNARISVMLNDSPGDGFTATGTSSAAWTWPVAPGSIVSAFGINLAPRTEAAAPNSQATTLGGIRLHVRDRSHTGDTLAPLLYVSPTQINYLLLSTDPFAWVVIERVGSPYVAQGVSVPISSLAPGLFTVGSGLAAAGAVRFAPDGSATQVTVTSCSGAVCSSVPIDLSMGTVYLSLYGTGFSRASAAYSSCTIAGQTAAPTYLGPQGTVVGLDQINVPLTHSLAGIGDTTIVCSFEANAYQVPQMSNAVKLRIQ